MTLNNRNLFVNFHGTNTERSEEVPSNCRLNCRTFKIYSLTVSEIRIEIFFSFSLKLQRTKGKQIHGFWEGVTEQGDDLKTCHAFIILRNANFRFAIYVHGFSS